MPMKPINIAITLPLPEKDDGRTIWSNGASQNGVFLYECLKRSNLAKNVWLVHGSGESCELPEGMRLENLKEDIRPLNKSLEEVDLLIELGLVISRGQADYVHERGGKVVGYRVGNDFYFTSENLLFNKSNWLPDPAQVAFDEIWTNEQHAKMCRSFFEVMHRCPVHILPHIWSPTFMDIELDAENGRRDKFGYRNVNSRKVAAVLEPNMNLVKTAIVPMLAINEFYREYPELLKHCYITNAVQFADSPTFNHLISRLEMNVTGRASVETRFPFPLFASGMQGVHLDIIVTHQWENGLNYLYYDVLYGNYPLVHNSPFLKDIGYYYEGFEIQQAAKALHQAATEHDANIDSYNRKAGALLASVNAESEENVRIYTDRIKALFAEG